ncbi:Double zinc ribbon [uncultured archaeon]|nr:Double zinc ribbon [uncultured archaeon]
MKCKECGYEFSSNAKFCPECGKPASLGNNKVNCRKCDYEMEGNLKFCPECGESVRSDNRGRRDKGDDDDEGGILGGLGDIVGKIFGG